MRNLLALIGLVVVLFFGMGWYFQWYTFAVQPSDNGQQRIELNVNTQKIVTDAKSGVNTVSKVIKESNEATTPVSTPTTATTPSTQPVKFEDLPSFFRPSPKVQ